VFFKATPSVFQRTPSVFQRHSQCFSTPTPSAGLDERVQNLVSELNLDLRARSSFSFRTFYRFEKSLSQGKYQKIVIPAATQLNYFFLSFLKCFVVILRYLTWRSNKGSVLISPRHQGATRTVTITHAR
jgi:hypothetical protein